MYVCIICMSTHITHGILKLGQYIFFLRKSVWSPAVMLPLSNDTMEFEPTPSLLTHKLIIMLLYGVVK